MSFNIFVLVRVIITDQKVRVKCQGGPAQLSRTSERNDIMSRITTFHSVKSSLNKTKNMYLHC